MSVQNTLFRTHYISKILVTATDVVTCPT